MFGIFKITDELSIVKIRFPALFVASCSRLSFSGDNRKSGQQAGSRTEKNPTGHWFCSLPTHFFDCPNV